MYECKLSISIKFTERLVECNETELEIFQLSLNGLILYAVIFNSTEIHSDRFEESVGI